jgi:hypothetical protein
VPRDNKGQESSGTLRTLNELVTLYELEPELSEVITEGRTDAAVLRWFFDRLASETAVYCVTDRLDITPQQVIDKGFNVGNKGYVITGALMLGEESAQAARKVTFIYDIDDDVITGISTPAADCLVSTDYTSMEMYCFAEKPISKLLKLTLRAREETTAASLLTELSKPLVGVFYARSILSRQDTPIGIGDAIERKCKLSGRALTIDLLGLIKDSIGAAGGSSTLGIDADAIVQAVQAAMANPPSDIRLAIRGHDFTRACCFYLKSKYPSLFKDDRLPFKTPEVFENVLITCLEVDDLMSEPLFQFLLKRHGPPGPRVVPAT